MVRKTLRLYCTNHGHAIPMRFEEGDWVVETKSANRVLKSELHSCPDCGRDVLVGVKLIDEHQDNESWKIVRDNARSHGDPRVATLVDENYMDGC